MQFVETLLDNGANVHIAGGKYHTALQAATGADNLEIVRILLQHGADPTVTGGAYGSALHAEMYAVDPVELIDALHEQGGDLNAVQERGTPLQLAAAVALTEVVSHLLLKGANPNMVFGKYGTPLQAACLMEDEETIDELLAHNADPFLRGGYFGSAFVAAAANGLKKYI
ncbi:ankyrin repeat-containing domain protein [Aspergillus crustosus]